MNRLTQNVAVVAWIICFDINGTKLWERIYGGELWDRPTSAT